MRGSIDGHAERVATPNRVAVWVCTLLLLAAGCDGGASDEGKDDPGTKPDIHDPDNPDLESDAQEVLHNASGHVDEARIRAAIVGSDIDVRVPVGRSGSGSLKGTVEVTVRDARDDHELGNAQLDFDQGIDDATHELTVEGAGSDLLRPATANLILDWKVALPAGDLSGHRSLYAALGSMTVQLRGATMLPNTGSSPLRVLVHDVDTGAAIDGAAVTASLVPKDATAGFKAKELFSGKTSAEGEYLAALELPMGVDAGRLRVEARDDDAQVWTYVDVQRAPAQQGVYLSADKTIYQPGQTISLRALALTSDDHLPIAKSEAVFEARDGKGNKVFRKRIDTDEFGVAAADVPTDVRVNEGKWTFSVTVAGGKQELAIPVNRYNLPKMNVTVAPEASFAMPGDTIKGAVDAFYVFGEPVASAMVALDVSAGGQALPRITGTTDAAGHFAFTLQVPDSLTVPNMDSTGSSLTFSATLTDGADQHETGGATIPLTAGPMLIDVVSEFGSVIPGIDNRVFVLVTDASGQPLAADVAIEVDGDPLATVRTSAEGVAEVTVKPSKLGARFRLTATDDAARTFTRNLVLSSEPGSEHLAVRADQSLYGPGEDVKLTVLSDAAVERAYVDVYQGARGVHSESVELQDGKADLAFTVSQEMRGIVFVDVFAYGSDGVPLRASRRLLIEGTDRLQVELASDADTYAPGADARVTVNVKDAFGDPQVAAVGLTVVNEASFQLGGEPGSDLVRHFGFDPATLPSSLSVLDLTPSSLFGGTHESRVRAADLLLSRAGKAEVPVLYYDALPTEQPLVAASVASLVGAEVQHFFAALSSLTGKSGLKPDALNALAKALADTRIDPFGQPYRVVQNSNSFAITFTSAGPDEKLDTADDATSQIAYGSLEASRIAANKVTPAPQTGNSAAAGSGAFGAAPPTATPGGFPTGVQAMAPTEMNADADQAAPSGPTVRKDFRETVYDNPVLITDAKGQATVSFPLAHSITSWRVSADGSTRDGKLGTGRHAFRTFQSFFVDFDVPTHLTKGDVIKLPAVVYNYLPEATTVTVSLQSDSFFTVVGGASQQLNLGPSEVRAATFQVQITGAGDHQFTLTGVAGDKQDAIARSALIDPDGQPEDQTFSGKVGASAVDHSVDLPADAVQGGSSLVLSLTPGFAAEAVSGLASMVREPNGCFEQTTSSAWPNTLIADYLQQTGEVDEQQMQQITDTVTRGYQRLLTFESPSGGFNWWGDSQPGNRILSAIMLWHLKDLEKLIDVDQAVRDRTLTWLVSQQQADGSWAAGDALHAGDEVLGTSVVRTTAFIVWALAHAELAPDAVAKAAQYIEGNEPPMTDLYANALSANALAFADPAHRVTSDLFSRLEGMKETDADGHISWPSDTPSWTGAGGGAVQIETTGLVAYGMIKAGTYPDSAAGAIEYLIANKDAVGSWYSTQATMNALRALGAAAGGQATDAEGALQVKVNGNVVQTIDISPDTNDLHREVDLSAALATGVNDVELSYSGSKEVAYQLTRRAYRPVLPAPVGPLGLQVGFDATDVNVGDTITANVTVTNNDTETRNQVIVRLGIAPGMVPNLDDLAALVRDGRIARFEVRDQDIVLYCMGVTAGEARKLAVRMIATLAADATAPASSVYAYYEPLLKLVRPAVKFNVH
jgi:phage gp46-like protein